MLSDFLDPAGYEAGLSALVGRGFQVDVVQILAPEELAPTTFGDLRLVDSETGGMQEVTFGRYRLQGLPADRAELRPAAARVLPGAAASTSSPCAPNTPLEELLLKQLRRAEVLGRNET